MLESVYQARLIKKLGRLFPGCVVLKNDTDYQQGIPDLIILFENKWAMLEVKASFDSVSQPNQEYFVELFDHMSFGAFICPENEREVLHDLQQTFGTRRPSRVSQRQ
jgi:hypothetical protein